MAAGPSAQRAEVCYLGGSAPVRDAHERAYGFGDGEGGRQWYDNRNVPPDSVVYTSLLQLIEEVGRDQK